MCTYTKRERASSVIPGNAKNFSACDEMFRGILHFVQNDKHISANVLAPNVYQSDELRGGEKVIRSFAASTHSERSNEMHNMARRNALQEGRDSAKL